MLILRWTTAIFAENLEALREIIVPTPSGAQIPLGQTREIERRVSAYGHLKSEGAPPNAWIYVDAKGIDVGTYVQMAQRAVNQAITNKTIQVPSGYNIFWSGQIPVHAARAATAHDRRSDHAAYHCPHHLQRHALTCRDRYRYALRSARSGWLFLVALPGTGHNLSVAVSILSIALADVSGQTGVVMLLFLDLAYDQRQLRKERCAALPTCAMR